VRLLLFGKHGQLGWELQRALAPLGSVIALGRADRGGDLCDASALAAIVRELRPDVIVNAAAYTAVDKAESDRDAAYQVNASAPEVLAREALALGREILLVHYSTDYVFDGSGSAPWYEDSPTGPLNVYGASKLAGEEAIRSSGCTYLILRTSWVYASCGQNFARTMLRTTRLALLPALTCWPTAPPMRSAPCARIPAEQAHTMSPRPEKFRGMAMHSMSWSPLAPQASPSAYSPKTCFQCRRAISPLPRGVR
jgi:dTDP-4-dehydrorhamnose reductase